MEGWLHVRGPSQTYKWQRRWCVLTSSSLTWYADSVKCHKKGTVQFTLATNAIHFAKSDAPGESSKYKSEKPYGFALDADPFAGKDRRIHYFDAGSEDSFLEWMLALPDYVSAGTGDIVEASEDIMSDSKPPAKIAAGTAAVVIRVDQDGDILLEVDGIDDQQWIFGKKHQLFQKKTDTAQKSVALMLVPLNSLVVHWALQIGTSTRALCYEFEADGVCIGRHTALDRGIPITFKDPHGSTRKSHRELSNWARKFGETTKYDVAGDNTLGGKNCQDFAAEFSDWLACDNAKLPTRQAHKVKAALASGAAAGAVAAADVAVGAGILAGAVEVGSMVGAAALGVALAPEVLAVGAVVAVGAGVVGVAHSVRGTWKNTENT